MNTYLQIANDIEYLTAQVEEYELRLKEVKECYVGALRNGFYSNQWIYTTEIIALETVIESIGAALDGLYALECIL